jgi:hypothetical protein
MVWSFAFLETLHENGFTQSAEEKTVYDASLSGKMLFPMHSEDLKSKDNRF